MKSIICLAAIIIVILSAYAEGDDINDYFCGEEFSGFCRGSKPPKHVACNNSRVSSIFPIYIKVF